MSSHKKITKVPNGPLVKKKGQFKGSTLKTGGKLKKAQSNGEYITKEDKDYNVTKRVNTKGGPRYYQGKSSDLSFARELASTKQFTNPADSIPKAKLPKRALEVMNQKNGGMIKRADGSYSQRGLWDNIRAAAKRNKAAGKPGKKPTAAMLKQERKIKAKGK
jgi:hypothetical protein